MRTLLSLRGNIPANIQIIDGKWHDNNKLDLHEPEPLAFYVMDKAYVDFEELYRFHKAVAFWISRPKDNMRYEVVDLRSDFDTKTGIRQTFTYDSPPQSPANSIPSPYAWWSTTTRRRTTRWFS